MQKNSYIFLLMAKFGLWASLESWSQMALNGTLINIKVKNMNWTSHSWLLLWRTFEYTIQSRFTKWIQRLDGGWRYALDLFAGLKALMGSWVHSPYFMVLSCLGAGLRADTHSNMKWIFNFFGEYINVLFHLWDLLLYSQLILNP